jgi:hypothetical protein
MTVTFWATLWYAGAAVISMGYEGQTEEQCKQITDMMQSDIVASYADPEMLADIEMDGIFPTNQFTVSCETTQLPVDEKYI